MANFYLHHYPASPFSEKIRALLGYLDLEWYSVETSIIMPRELVRADAQELAVRRTTAETGAVVTHFPRIGFALES